MATIDGGAALFAEDLAEVERNAMTTKMVQQAICDRCGAVIGSEDDDAGQLCIDEWNMSDEWESSGRSRMLGDVCGTCVRSLKAWMQSGGAKRPQRDGQS